MKSENRGLSKEIIHYLGAQRIPGGYRIIDHMSGNVIAEFWVAENANDVLNTRLRDTFIRAYYEYGKKLGAYH